MRWIWGLIFAVILAIAAAGWWYVYERKVEVITLKVASGARDSDSYLLMSEVAEVLQRHSQTLRLDVQESRNSSENISAINLGYVDLATIQANTPAYTNVKLVADLFPDYFLLVARENGPIKNVLDMKGNRIAIPEDGSTGSMAFWSVVDHYSIAPEGIRTLSTPREKGAMALLTGKADAIFLLNSLRDPFLLLKLMEEARLRGIGLHFVSIEQAEAMSLKRPFLEARKVVRGAFDGGLPMPKRDIFTPSVKRYLVAGADVADESIHELVKIIFENRLDLLIRMSLTSAITNPQDANGASLPVHAGAARFYDRDKPSFLQENAEPMALVVTILAMLISASLGLRRTLQNRAKNRGDVYNDLVLNIRRRTHDTSKAVELSGMMTELDTILETAVQALDGDKITEEGFQSFAFLWQATKDTLQEKLSAQA